MAKRTVLIRYEEDERAWRIYWTDTLELAHDQAFPTIEAAGPTARALMEGETVPRRPALGIG